MTIYEQEIQRLNTLRARIARFYRVAVHCHTPLSHDWARSSGDPGLNDRQKYLGPGGEGIFLREVMARTDPRPEVLVPTDHMKCEYAARLASVSSRLGVVVLPGMEVSVRMDEPLGNVKIHVLVVLPPGSTQESFTRLLPGAGEEKDRSGKEELKLTDLRSWLQQVRDAGGVSIAAHVEGDRGIRKCFRQTAKDVLALVLDSDADKEEEQKRVEGALRDLLFRIGFDAIEVKAASDDVHYHWVVTGEERGRIPTVLGVDAHSIEEYQRPERLTLIKMTSPETRGLDGLKDALKFPDTRIRFRSDLPTPTSPTLLGLVIVGTENDTFFPDLLLAMSDNLNCIIGPRGAGKSTVVEALRYVFGYNRTLRKELGPEMFERVISLQRFALRGATIRVYYRTSRGDILALQSTYDPEQDYTTRVFRPDGTDAEIADVETNGSFPLRLYGWSEIETLGREGWKQRAALDRMIPKIGPLDQERTGLRQSLGRKRTEIQTKIADLQMVLTGNDREMTRWREYRAGFAKYDIEDLRAMFGSLDLALAKISVLDKVSSNAEALQDDLRRMLPVGLTKGLNPPPGGEPSLRSWWNDGKPAGIDLPAMEKKAADAVQDAIDTLGTCRTEVAAEKAGLESEARTLNDDLRKRVSASPEQENVAVLRQDAKRRFDRATEVRNRYRVAWRELRDMIAAHWRISRALLGVQGKITEARRSAVTGIEGKLNQFFKEDLKISVLVKDQGDRNDFRTRLQEFIRTIQQKNDAKWREVLAAVFTPNQLVDVLLRGKAKSIGGKSAVGSDGRSYALADKDGNALMGKARWAVRDDGADVDVLTEEGSILLAILGLREIRWDDEVIVLLNGKPVASCSPGQRSSAMLPLIMLAETSPLVIDQPEDNLDNSMVGGVLAEILAERKEQRQIIACTHNPNIVVLGDAEQVIPLNPESDRKGQIGPCECGSIDHPDIVATIIATMEGGREAFRARHTRYNL